MKIICAAPSLKEWNAYIKSIKAREFNVMTAADILDMDDFEVKLLMLYNPQFYTLAIEALGQYVDMYLAQTNEFIRKDWEGEDPAPQFDSLDELLYGSDYFGTDPESSRCEFVHVFQDVLWDYASPSDR